MDKEKDDTVVLGAPVSERPTSDESSGEVPVASDADADDEGREVVAGHRSAPALTMSNARAVALVATVTGASFLNVRTA